MALQSAPPAAGTDLFTPLIDAVCASVDIAPASVWLDTPTRDARIATFQIEGIECVLSHRSPHPDTVFVHCIFGRCPDVRRVEALQALLQLNLLMYTGRSPAFAMDAEQQLMLCLEFPLQLLDAQALVHTLENLATQAMAWRKVWLAHE